MKFEIKHRFSGSVIFSCETESLGMAVDIAIKSYASLSYANLRYADLRDADLRNANLSYADLRDANLRYADLRNANLSYANLSNANLGYVNLSNANLGYVNLSNANLRNANLSYVNLRNANLHYADLMIFQYQQHPAYYTFDGTLRIGCMCLPITEWKETFEDIGLNNSYSEDQIKTYGQFIDMCYEHFMSKEN